MPTKKIGICEIRIASAIYLKTSISLKRQKIPLTSPVELALRSNEITHLLDTLTAESEYDLNSHWPDTARSPTCTYAFAYTCIHIQIYIHVYIYYGAEETTNNGANEKKGYQTRTPVIHNFSCVLMFVYNCHVSEHSRTWWPGLIEIRISKLQGSQNHARLYRMMVELNVTILDTLFS